MEREVVYDGADAVAVVSGVSEVPAVEPGVPLVLSRFAWTRRDQTGLVVESARGLGRIELRDPRAARLVVSFAAPRSASEAHADPDGLSAATIDRLIATLLAIGALVDPADAAAEDAPPLAVWEFHDLLFHARHRSGRHLNPGGGTYRFLGRFDSAPARPARRWPVSVKLARPDFGRLAAEDPPLSAVQAARSSIREYGATPIDVGALGEFLFRVGRIEDIQHRLAPDHSRLEEYIARPYPSGGSLYELEFYLAVARCEGVEPGLYRYDGGEHVLEQVCHASPELDRLLTVEGRGATLELEQLQVVVLLTARMPRIAWKYASLAYGLVLKHVGVLYDQMYLAATAMELAPCAIGGGDSDLFAQVAGIDYYEESLVGEFALGRPARRPA
jgi:SagB-type dehydrogenase family enzyme